MRFVKVTRDNKNRDRGFIAVDAICAAFENQEKKNTSIMTVDGFWYEIVDEVERLYEAVEHSNEEYQVVQSEEEQDSNKLVRIKTQKRIQSAGVEERKEEVSVAEFQEEEKIPKAQKPIQSKSPYHKPYVKQRKFRKYGYKGMKGIRQTDVNKDFPSGDGEGHYELNPKAEVPSIGEGL